jgi:tetraprenyl-beta-curcumene synthase
VVETEPTLRWRPLLVVALLQALLLYWLVIFPRARRELRRWERRARAIPSPDLRRHALGKLNEEHSSAEGAAAFAILARPRGRKHVVRLCVAFEVMYDLLDALTEEPVDDVLANNLALHEALPDAFGPLRGDVDYYAHHPDRDDGGYLGELVRGCQVAFLALPARDAVAPVLVRCAMRARQAQSLNHASRRNGVDALAAWAMQQFGEGHGAVLCWWEAAAAAGSPLGIFALVAAASHSSTDAHDARTIEETYFPWIASLHWLMESLVDQDDDRVSGNRSYVGEYGSRAIATARLRLIARRALMDTRRLPQANRHTLLLAGMVALNLSHPGAAAAEGHDAAAVVRAEMGGLVAPLLVALRIRRQIGRCRMRAPV